MLLTKRYKRDIINKSHQKTEVFGSQTIKFFEKIFKKVLTNGWRCDKILKLSKDRALTNRAKRGEEMRYSSASAKRERGEYEAPWKLNSRQERINDPWNSRKRINFGLTITKNVSVWSERIKRYWPKGEYTTTKEFDPGSGRTLAARLTHASRTGERSLLLELVADGWVTREQPAFQRGTTVGNDC